MVVAALPASIKTWLGQQLELRGIDAVIYTRYILSILQQDSRDLELGDQERRAVPGTGCCSQEEWGQLQALQAGQAGSRPKAVNECEKRGSREVECGGVEENSGCGMPVVSH